MKYYFILLVYLLLPLFAWTQTSINGRILESGTHLPIAGATIYIPDLKSGAISDANGSFILKNLPKAKFLIQVKLLGFTSITKSVNPLVDTLILIELESASIEASEVVVTGSPFTTDNSRTSLSVIPIEKKTLIHSGAANISAALEKIPGLSSVSTGGGIGKPVIRGLGYNRIVTIQNGTRQEGQQWGDEHGLEIEEFSADRIEILKGPGSLMYGSDALGGVINILEPIPPPSGQMRTELNAKYSNNNRANTISILNEGNLSGMVWSARGTVRNAGAYKSANEYIYNSAFKDRNFNFMLGGNGKWGYSHLHLSSFNSEVGLVEGERDSASGLFTNLEGETVANNIADSKKINLPQQQINHSKAAIVNSIFIGRCLLKLDAAYQFNQRREFEDDIVLPSLQFDLATTTADARFYFPENKGWESVIGLSSLHQENINKGEEFLIPAYRMYNAGGFISVKKNYKKLTWNIGGRFDIRNIEGESLIVDDEQKFSAFNNEFSAFSGSAGLTYEINNRWNLKINVGRGFRAPNISELSANGIHEGTFRYELGNASLKPELSLQGDAGLNFHTSMISADVSAFYNYINNFIYYRNFNNQSIEVEGERFPVYRYIQGASNLKGFEVKLDIHPFDALHLDNSISYVEGENDDLKVPLPFIPPLHIRNEITWNLPAIKSLNETYLTIGLDNYFKQDKIDAFEKSTKGYNLLFAGVGTEIKLRGTIAEIYLVGENLLNEAYASHLSRLKDIGVLNQGRNITAGINLKLQNSLFNKK